MTRIVIAGIIAGVLTTIFLVLFAGEASAHRPMDPWETEVRARKHINTYCWKDNRRCIRTSNTDSPGTGLLRVNTHSRDYHGWYQFCSPNGNVYTVGVEVRVSAHDGTTTRIGTATRYDRRC